MATISLILRVLFGGTEQRVMVQGRVVSTGAENLTVFHTFGHKICSRRELSFFKK